MAIVEKHTSNRSDDRTASSSRDPRPLENVGDARKINKRNTGYVQEILEPVNAQEGNQLSVGTLVANGMTTGEMPLGTASMEKRASL